jgi:hypothetical protein
MEMATKVIFQLLEFKATISRLYQFGLLFRFTFAFSLTNETPSTIF